jgi:hypothetical protein
VVAEKLAGVEVGEGAAGVCTPFKRVYSDPGSNLGGSCNDESKMLGRVAIRGSSDAATRRPYFFTLSRKPIVGLTGGLCADPAKKLYSELGGGGAPENLKGSEIGKVTPVA